MDKEQKQMLVDALKRYHDCAFTPGVYEHSIVGQAALILEKSEEVVRCKDCQHWDEYHEGSLDGPGTGMGVCLEGSNWVDGKRADDFCSYGERKDNERKAD